MKEIIKITILNLFSIMMMVCVSYSDPYMPQGTIRLASYQNNIPDITSLKVFNNRIKANDNNKTIIYCDLHQPGNLALSIYDIKTRTIKTIADALYTAGKHSFSWDGRDNAGNMVGSGVYIIFMTANGMRDYKKINVIR